MKNCFTRNDVLRFIYQETDEKESEIIRAAITEDDDLGTFYIETMATLEQLDTVSYEPSQKSVDNILHYAKSFNLHPV